MAAGFYPLAEAVQAIGGDRVKVVSLTAPGVSPHDAEPPAAALSGLEQSDLAFYLGENFQPAVQKAIDGVGADTETVDLLEGIDLRPVDSGIPGVRGEVDGEVLEGGRDPHVWVDPAQFIAMAERIQAELIDADPDGRGIYEANGRAYIAGLKDLDDSFKGRLDTCDTRTLVTSHAAFGYLADRYDLKQAPIAGISPGDEPDPQSLAATAKLAEADGVQTVFFESLVPKDLAETVAAEIGAKTDALNPVEGLTEDEIAAGATYSSIQADNLRRLEKGLGCTRG